MTQSAIGAGRGSASEVATEKEKFDYLCAPALRSDRSRTISSLPLHLPPNYTPHYNLEFDSAVQNYCRNQVNYANVNSYAATKQQADCLGSGRSKRSKSPACGNSSATNSAGGAKIARNCKVVVCGDVAVGKTCLVNRFGNNHQISATLTTHQTTIGVDFDLQRFTILGQPYVLQIWDTAGLERFRCITSSYYRGCQVALIVFDMSNMSSLASVTKWRDEVLASCKTFDQLTDECANSDHAANTDCVRLRPDVGRAPQAGANSGEHEPLIFLVGTKCDLPIAEPSRAFMVEQANRLAALLKAELWFVSAQTGENVDELFERVAALSFNRSILQELQRLKFEASTMGANLKEKLMQQQRELWGQSSKLIKITKKKDGDERRTRCVNIQCVIK